MFDKIKNSIQNKLNTIKEENEKYKELLNTTTILSNLSPLPNQNQKQISEHIIHYITTNCPNINQNKAILIANLIPLEETYLEVYYAKEILTNKEFFIIPTNLRLWIINPTEYIILPLDNHQISIIKNNLMSKTILFNNILLEINGNNEKVDTLINILTNPTLRKNIILERTKYLCGITPIYQNINSINSGISIDKEKNIVIHNKENNHKCNIIDITNYEILLDNQSYYSKDNTQKKVITTFNSSCYQITIRITIQNNYQIIMPILEQNAFGTKYQSHDSIYQNNLNFAMTIIKTLENLLTNQN